MSSRCTTSFLNRDLIFSRGFSRIFNVKRGFLKEKVYIIKLVYNVQQLLMLVLFNKGDVEEIKNLNI